MFAPIRISSTFFLRRTLLNEASLALFNNDGTYSAFADGGATPFPCYRANTRPLTRNRAALGAAATRRMVPLHLNWYRSELARARAMTQSSW